MNKIRIILEKCVGCGVCKNKCPYNAIRIENKKAIITDSCTLCRICLSNCKFKAIEAEIEDTAEVKMGTDEASIHDISKYKGIWVFVEVKGRTVSKVALELISEAKKLASWLGTEVSAILLGHNVESIVQNIINYGADNVYIVDHPFLYNFNDEKYSKIIIELINRYKPDIFLLGATVYGRSLAPRIAAALNTGLTADCTQLDIDSEKKILLQTRPAFGGDLMATIICPNSKPQMATVRPGIFKASKSKYQRAGKVIRPDIKIPDSKVEILQYIEDVTENFDISSAEVIVAAGRGIGDKKNLQLVEELASMIGGKIGASRAIVDEGWIERCHQVGQSGNTVSPKLYIACGISGAIQHVVGLKSSSVIIAINKDIDAPIMKVANYAFVGDVIEILSTLINEIKRLGTCCNSYHSSS
jgi:electron transfer flavoprotein alpha subunit